MSIYNEDELNIPTWLNKTFLETVLSEYDNQKSVEIVNLELSPASQKGDHYASIMFRAKIVYKLAQDQTPTHKSIIIKTIPEEEGKKREVLTRSNLFETEISMYSRTLPKIEQVLAEHGEIIKLAPNLIYHALSPHKVIVLEDLCVSGYTCLRGRYLTENVVRTVYQKLAKMHAVTYMLGRSEEHAAVTAYQSGIFSTREAEKNPFIANGIKKLIKIISEDNELCEYLPKIKELETEMFEQCTQLFNAYKNGSADDILVLNHGDFHLKNMMFKFNSAAELEDFQLVDFQISVYAPSVIDLIYSTYMLLSPELRTKRNELMHFYFTNFVDTLKQIQYKGKLPKFADFQIATIKYRHFSLLLLSTFLPLFYSMVAETPGELKGAIEDGTDLHQNPEYVAEVKRLLPIYLQEGYLD